MNYTIDEEINIMERYSLTADELFVIRTILSFQNGENDYLFRFNRILTENSLKLRQLLLSLQNKGVILKSYKLPSEGENFDPESVEFNKNFLKGFYKESFELGKELLACYPEFANINGHLTAINSVAKRFDSREDFFIAYGKAIRWNPETHQEILDLITWAKNNTNFIQFSICNFLIDRRWETLKRLKDGELVNVNFDTLKDV